MPQFPRLLPIKILIVIVFKRTNTLSVPAAGTTAGVRFLHRYNNQPTIQSERLTSVFMSVRHHNSSKKESKAGSLCVSSKGSSSAAGARTQPEQILTLKHLHGQEGSAPKPRSVLPGKQQQTDLTQDADPAVPAVGQTTPQNTTPLLPKELLPNPPYSS